MYQQTASCVRTSQIHYDVRENCCTFIFLIEKFLGGSAFSFTLTSSREYFHNEYFIFQYIVAILLLPMS